MPCNLTIIGAPAVHHGEIYFSNIVQRERVATFIVRVLIMVNIP